MNYDDEFYERLAEIAAQVEKWPEWKRTGWVYLDLNTEAK